MHFKKNNENTPSGLGVPARKIRTVFSRLRRGSESAKLSGGGNIKNLGEGRNRNKKKDTEEDCVKGGVTFNS